MVITIIITVIKLVKNLSLKSKSEVYYRFNFLIKLLLIILKP